MIPSRSAAVTFSLSNRATGLFAIQCILFRINSYIDNSVADLRGGVPGTHAPWGKFFHFYAVFGKKLQKNGLLHPPLDSLVERLPGYHVVYLLSYIHKALKPPVSQCQDHTLQCPIKSEGCMTISLICIRSM